MLKKDKRTKYAFINFVKSSVAREVVKKCRIEIRNNLVANVYYAKPKFPESFHQKIHPKLSEYINAITKDNKNYNPKQFICLHDFILGRKSTKSTECKKIMEASGNNIASVLELISKRKHGNSAKKELFDSSSDSQEHTDTEIFILDSPRKDTSHSYNPRLEHKASFFEKNDSRYNLGQESTFINQST